MRAICRNTGRCASIRTGNLIEAGRDQARLTSSYEFAVQQNSELQAEIKRLEELLRLPAFTNYRAGACARGKP